MRALAFGGASVRISWAAMETAALAARNARRVTVDHCTVRSRLAANNVIRQLAQAFGAVVEGPQRQVSRDPLFLGHLVRALQPIHGRKGDLLLLRVLASRLSERLG